MVSRVCIRLDWRGLRCWLTRGHRFLAPEKIETVDGTERAIQRALVEVCVMKQETGTSCLPAKIGNPTDDFSERLATGVVFHNDMSLEFKDGTLQDFVARSLGLRHDEGAHSDETGEKLDHVSEDMFEGRRFGRNATSPAETEASNPEPAMGDQVIEEPVTELAEDVIAIGGHEEVIEQYEKPLSPVEQSYQQVAFQQPDVKFAVCALSLPYHNPSAHFH